ncbi:MAG: 2-dehydropantoate 2-reductase N-terminal domain-containing protein, partial [Actinomycetes bacterium]
MIISIIGLGYVGAVTGSTLADMGHSVTVVDRDQTKVDLLNQGQSPIPEPGLQQLVTSGLASG